MYVNHWISTDAFNYNKNYIKLKKGIPFGKMFKKIVFKYGFRQGRNNGIIKK